MKFATKVTIFLLIILLVVGGFITYFTYISSSRILEGQIRARLENRAYFIMNLIDMMLFEKFADIKVIANDAIISSKDATPAQITQRLIEYRDIYKTYASFSFFDNDKIRIADTAGLEVGKKHPYKMYWEDNKDASEFMMDVIESVALKKPVLHFGAFVKDESGEVLGIVVSRILVSRINDIIKDNIGVNSFNELEIDLVNKDGLLIYSNYNPGGELKEKLPTWDILKELTANTKIGSGVHRHSGKEELFYAFAVEQGYLDFKGNKWMLIFHLPARVALASAVKLGEISLVIMFLGVLIAIIFAIFFSKTISGPILRLSAAASEIGKGKLDTKIPVKSKDEIGKLAESFNTMAADLKNSYETIEHQNLNLTDTNNHLEATTKELKKTNNELMVLKEDLELRVKTRTADVEMAKRELEVKVQELEKFYKILVGRELRMAELKEKIAEMEKNLRDGGSSV